MKNSLGRKILIGFTASAVILIGVAIFSYRNSEEYVESNKWVDHTNKVIAEFSLILLGIVDAETGARGYVLTGEEPYLEPFNEGKKAAFEHLDNVRELTKDNPVQQKNIDELERSVKKAIDFQQSYIDQRKTDFEKAKETISTGQGKRNTDAVRNIIAKSTDLEKGLLEKRKNSNTRDANNFNIVFGILILIILIVLVVVYFIIISNIRAINRAEKETANKNWLLSGNAELNDQTQGEKEVEDLTRDIIAQLATYLKASVGTIYIKHEDQLVFAAGYAYEPKDMPPLKFGQSLVGQAALEKKPIVLNQVPDDYIKINSGLGNSKPKHLLVYPFIFSGHVKGVIELGSVHEFSPLDLQFLNLVSENIGIAVNSSQSRTLLKELLEETQVQSEELQSQQEELRQVNEELEEQAQNLKQQQEELQMTNEELEEQTQMLEIKNKEVEASRKDIEEKTKQLELSSKYKSEFLANMSHELRTPLNSLLILSKDLADNKKKNLNEDQVESAEIIHKSGQDLLVLINEVLDLSKIEAGKMSVNVERVVLKNMVDQLLLDFKHMAFEKRIKLNTRFGNQIPESIRTDSQRLNQVLKNLLSNAIKFTEKGEVSIHINRKDDDHISISVVDTGIGIPEDKQLLIFEAFQQADGGTSRKYGGTGLGLSISRELARLLGAEITLKSIVNQGSEFTIILPLEIVSETEPQKRIITREPVLLQTSSTHNSEYLNYPALDDDRNTMSKEDKVVLIIEDDLKFAAILLKQTHEKGFKGLSAATGEDGLELAKKYKPVAIILDIDLPGINGHQVLAELKADPTVRHIPVHIISVNERSLKPIKEGAVEYLMKPVGKKELEDAFSRMQDFINRKMKNLLIIEDDANSRRAMCKLIGNGDVKCFEAGTAKEALTMYKDTHFDCIVLDIGLPDMNGFELIYQFENIKDRSIPPIIIYTGKDLSKEENEELQKYAESIIIKGVKSEERLLDETALFLHRTISNLPDAKKEIIHHLYDKEAIFSGKKILMVDDDMRNIFALSKILKEKGMNVIKADNGLVALEMLKQNPDTAMILMDIMMPEMDGYEAMREIRKDGKNKSLPIIALTAKAMMDDKQKCIDAGANDYIPKPVDVERLLSLMRVWLTGK